MANKKKRCKHCREYFHADTMVKVPAGTFCTIGHALEFANKKDVSQRDKAHKERKKKFYDNDRAYQLKLAQKEFNAFIRERDKRNGYGCISCGTQDKNIQYAAGHYRSVGAAPHLRFNQRNVHLQCNKRCNSELSSNSVEYRKGLVARYGEDFVKSIEYDNTIRKFTIEEIRAIKNYYRAITKRLREK